MFKLGIHKKQQLRSTQLDGFVNRRKFIAVDLYDCIDDLPVSDIDYVQERILRWLRVHNGVLKCTYNQRFKDFDRLSLSAIVANFPLQKELRVHDIGVSDGRTSCTFYEHLTRLYREQLQFIASDYKPYLYVLKRTQSRNRLIIDDKQNVLQIIVPPFVFNEGRPERLLPYPVNALVRRLLTPLLTQPLLRDYRAGSPNIQRRQLHLVCGLMQQYIRTRANVRFEEYDVLSGPTEQAHILRAMNIFNHTYFTEVQLRRAIDNVVRSLTIGGLFITGSNNEQRTPVDGAIYRRTDQGFESVHISGKGSHIDCLLP